MNTTQSPPKKSTKNKKKRKISISEGSTMDNFKTLDGEERMAGRERITTSTKKGRPPQQTLLTGLNS